MAEHQGVLRWVNARRKEMGLEPLDALVPGRLHMASSCPIARSLRAGTRTRVRTGSKITRIGDEIHVFKHPSWVQSFIRKFDRGAFPELRAKR